MSSVKQHYAGLLGRKLGMTQIFNKEGLQIPVTAIDLGPCFVVQVKSAATDGYDAVSLGFNPKKQQRVNKPMAGVFKKGSKGAFYHLREVRCDTESLGWNEVGKELHVDEVFKVGETVAVTGKSKGKGFAGVVKSYGVSGQPATRGTHEMRRHIGSIGCRKSPGRVWKNKKMPGHLGNTRVTMKNLTVVDINPERNIMFVKGCVPGAKNGLLYVKRVGELEITPSSKEAA